MNTSPYTVSPNTRISQVFNLFRTMGLRHLPVVNAVGEVSPPRKHFVLLWPFGWCRKPILVASEQNFCWFQIVGIITRHNLTHEFLVAKLRQHYITIWRNVVAPPCSAWPLSLCFGLSLSSLNHSQNQTGRTSQPHRRCFQTLGSFNVFTGSSSSFRSMAVAAFTDSRLWFAFINLFSLHPRKQTFLHISIYEPVGTQSERREAGVYWGPGGAWCSSASVRGLQSSSEPKRLVGRNHLHSMCGD